MRRMISSIFGAKTIFDNQRIINTLFVIAENLITYELHKYSVKELLSTSSFSVTFSELWQLIFRN
jgi:hypothetical protein